MDLDAFVNEYWKHVNNPMPKSEQADILKKSIEHNGTETELVIIMEELSELIQQVSKRYRGKNYAMHLLEEMADVYICLEELKLITGISNDDIEAAMSVKFERIRNDIQKSSLPDFDLHEYSGLLE